MMSPNIEAVKSRIDWAKPYSALQAEQNRPPLRSLNVRELLELEIPPRRMILSPILPAQGLVMLYAPRGHWEDPRCPLDGLHDCLWGRNVWQ